MENNRKDSSLYRQTARKIIEQIYSGTWKEGELLPVEKELAELFRVSRGTVRKAVGELENLGFLHRVQGSGTYVDRNFNMERKQKALYYTELLLLKCAQTSSDGEEWMRFLGKLCGYPKGWYADVRIGYADLVRENQQDMKLQLEQESSVLVDLYSLKEIREEACRREICRRDKALFVAERYWQEARESLADLEIPVLPLKAELENRCAQWLTSIPRKDLLVIFYETTDFLDEVCNILYGFGMHKTNMFFSVDEMEMIREVEWNRATCILPAIFLKTSDPKIRQIIRYLTDHNCRIVPIIYTPEQKIRRQIQELVEERKKNGNEIL